MKGGAMKVTRELVVPAPIEEVWQALTDPDRLEEWFANDVELDLERGEGVFRWESGEVRRAVVEEVEPGRRLSLHWWDDEARDEPTEVAFTLEEVGEGTRIVVTESTPDPSACACEWIVGLELRALAAPGLIAA
jgi:uncharacterized protein YndB with AHSA1/START domain